MTETWHAGDFYDCICACVDGKHGDADWVASVAVAEPVYHGDETIVTLTARRDAIVADHAAAQQLEELRGRYGRLIEEMARILRAVRISEGEQLSHSEIADRAVAAAQQLIPLRTALEKIANWDVAPGMVETVTTRGVETRRIAREALEALSQPAQESET